MPDGDRDPKELLREFREALKGDSGEAMAQELLDNIRERYGEEPLVARVLRARPELYVPMALKSSAVIRDSPLGPKVAELLAVSAAAAMLCEPCLLIHIKQALRAGASEDEVLSATLIAGSIAESSVQAYAFRALGKAVHQTEGT